MVPTRSNSSTLNFPFFSLKICLVVLVVPKALKFVLASSILPWSIVI